MYFGLMTSLNGLIVIIGTPILTKCASSLSDTAKLLTGQLLVCTALSMYIFIQGIIPMYYISMILFTLGEIITTLGSYPYLTRRIPASHRGRISSLAHIFLAAAMYGSQWKIASILQAQTITTAWKFITAAGTLGAILYLILIKTDQKTYPLLYPQKASKTN